MPIDLQTVDEAKALLEGNSAFVHAVAKLRKQWFNELMSLDSSAPYFDRHVMGLTCKMQALEAIPRELAVLIQNFHHDQRRHSTPSVSPKDTRLGDIADAP
jgi:hypothetical protein